MMRDARQLLIGIVLLSGCAAQLSQQAGAEGAAAQPLQVAADAVDPDASNYAYPYPVKFFEFDSQLQHLRLAYLDVAPSGQSNGRTVLLLHGKNFTAAAWASSIAFLSERGFRVIAPDQIGFGKSTKPVAFQFSFAGLASHTRALLASLGIDRSAVVGHSMGGMLAARYALTYPEHTERLVLVNPIGLEDYAALSPYRSLDDWYQDELKQTPDKIRDYQKNAYYAGQWNEAFEALAKLQMNMTKHPDYARVAWCSARLYEMIFTQPVVHDLSRIAVPTGLIIGTRDRTALGKPFAKPEVAATMGDYTQLGKRTRDLIPGAKLVEIEGVGHIPQVEAADRYRDALLGLLE